MSLTMESVADRLGALREQSRRLADSPQRFEDGGHYRVEIPSVENVDAFKAVLQAGEDLEVPIHRISQGSGITLLRDTEIRDYASLGREAEVEVCLFVGPRAPWDGSASPLAPAGNVFGWRHMTLPSLTSAYDDVRRAVDLGIRSILVADEGLLVLLAEARRTGEVPADLVIKASAMMGIANPLGAQLIANQGANSINIAGDTPVQEVAAFRHALPPSTTIDLYVEGPDALGGFLRYHDVPDIVRLGSPIYLKFGLRNAPDIYPAGFHLGEAVLTTATEKVRRAAIGIEVLERSGQKLVGSASRGSKGLPL